MPQVGDLLMDRYSIDAFLGAGGMGAVYRALDTKFNRVVAIKVLHAHLCQDEACVARFSNEVRCIAALSHPNTLRLYDTDTLPSGSLFMVMEYLQGDPLDRLFRSQSLNVFELLSFVAQVCSALQEAHDAGIVHRDLKPQNIFIQRIGDEMVAKVLDFGIAKLMGELHQVTSADQILGTPAYMSPEQAGSDEITASTDMYSLGVLLWEGLTGRPLFSGPTPWSVLAAHIGTLPPKLYDVADYYPDSLVRLLEEMLAKDASKRPGSMREVKSRLELIIDEMLRPAEQRVPRRRKSKYIIALVMSTVFVFIVATGTYVFVKFLDQKPVNTSNLLSGRPNMTKGELDTGDGLDSSARLKDKNNTVTDAGVDSASTDSFRDRRAERNALKKAWRARRLRELKNKKLGKKNRPVSKPEDKDGNTPPNNDLPPGFFPIPSK